MKQFWLKFFSALSWIAAIAALVGPDETLGVAVLVFAIARVGIAETRCDILEKQIADLAEAQP